MKTDRRDARALADPCVLGACCRAHRLSDVQRQVRGRLLVRDALVRARTRYICVIRALLRQQGYRVPSGSAEDFPTRVRTLALPGPLLSLISPLLAVMRHLNRQLAYSDETIEHVAAHDERVQRLRSVPSIGPVTAAFVATIDDVQRFPHAHRLEAYLGLVPREDSSGDTQRRGPITKAGSSRTRWLLIQAAVAILRRRPPEAEALRTWALRIAARRGEHVAIVALARRLAGILYALLRDDTVFTPRRTSPPVAAALPTRAIERPVMCPESRARSTRVGERECRLDRRSRVAA